MALIEAEQEIWEARDESDRIDFINEISRSYHLLVLEFYNESNSSGRWYRSLKKSHFRWRLLITVGAGLIALLNVIMGFDPASGKEVPWIGLSVTKFIAFAGAIVATIVTIITRFETFGSAHERAPGYRQARDLFLDAGRDYEGRWRESVRPFQPRAEACVNAVRLNNEIITKDRELRAQFREMTSMGDSSQ